MEEDKMACSADGREVKCI